MNFTLYTANCIGNPQNSLYPDKVEINGADDMKALSLTTMCAQSSGTPTAAAPSFSPQTISPWIVTTTTPTTRTTG